MIDRQVTWLRNFEETLSLYKTTDFVWGESDCALFVCDCLKAIYGKDFAASFRGQYKTEFKALKLLKQFSKAGLLETIDKIVVENGGRIVQNTYAEIGDVTYGPAYNMGIVVGSQFAFMSPKGFATLDIKEADQIWTLK